QELTLAQFEPARYDDPNMRRAAVEQIEIRADPALGEVQAVVEIDIDGETFKARCDHPRGSPENPLSRAQIEDKLRTYSDGVASRSHTDGEGARSRAVSAGTMDGVNNLERVGSVRNLMEMLGAAPPRSPSERGTVAAVHA